MLYIRLVVLALAIRGPANVKASFYDNPELDLPAPDGTPVEELEAKWGFEVCRDFFSTLYLVLFSCNWWSGEGKGGGRWIEALLLGE